MAAKKAIAERLVGVRMLIVDVDGVLTAGHVWVSDDGTESVAFYAPDGLGIVMLQEEGFLFGAISGRLNPAVNKRLIDLGVHKAHIYTGVRDKSVVLDELLSLVELSEESIAYIGDDVNDISVLKRVGFAVTVPNAHHSVMPYAHYVCIAAGGHGAVREVCDLLIAHNTHKVLNQ